MSQLNGSAEEARRFRKRRAGVLRAARAEKRVDAMLATDTADIRYLCGLHEGSQSLLFGDKWSVLLTRKMFARVAPGQCPGTEVVLSDNDAKKIAEEVGARGVRRLGVEEALLHVPRHRVLTRKLGRKLVKMPQIVVEYRAVKDEQEIHLTRKAVRIAERAFREMMASGAGRLIGQTEKKLAADLEYRMRCLGADRQGFGMTGIIIGSGPNSASCHHLPTARKVKRGEPVLFDWGAEVDGYRSDMTRVMFAGKPSDQIAEIYSVVEKALHASTRKLRPGAVTGDIYNAAFDVIDAAGYAEQFPHGLGHGIGLVIHEQPRFSRGLKDRLKRGMIVTIEPGIYLDGEGGVRLENDILLKPGGHQVLGSLPTKLSRAILV
jgi:Xaa-Pro aminopeptidase